MKLPRAGGAYRLLRHPSYTAGILMNLGIGLSLGSWGSTALLAVVSFAVYAYREFLRQRKRLIPYVF